MARLPASALALAFTAADTTEKENTMSNVDKDFLERLAKSANVPARALIDMIEHLEQKVSVAEQLHKLKQQHQQQMQQQQQQMQAAQFNATPSWALDDPKPSPARVPHRKRSKPIVAVRAWHLTMSQRGDWAVQSVARSDIWDSPNIRADCAPDLRYDGFLLQHLGTGHGIHAVTVPGALLSHYATAAVFGAVTLHGRVVVHEHGYRAERATIQHLLVVQDGIEVSSAFRSKDQAMRITHSSNSQLRLSFFLDEEKIKSDLSRRYQCDVQLVPFYTIRREMEKWISEESSKQ